MREPEETTRDDWYEILNLKMSASEGELKSSVVYLFIVNTAEIRNLISIIIRLVEWQDVGLIY
jgi:hypothetical protein